MKTIQIKIPTWLATELKKLCPNRGMKTQIVTELLTKFVENVDKLGGTTDGIKGSAADCSTRYVRRGVDRGAEIIEEFTSLQVRKKQGGE